MDAKHKKALKSMLSRYGTAQVVAHLTAICQENCRTDYADNPGAIIHADTASLERCVREMGRSHPILGTARTEV
jgi:hypothetical protein